MKEKIAQLLNDILTEHCKEVDGKVLDHYIVTSITDVTGSSFKLTIAEVFEKTLTVSVE